MTKTDDLIETLVSDLAPMHRHALRLRLASALAVGLIGACIALLVSLDLHSHLRHVTTAAFWVKFCYTAVLMVAAIFALDRVARPEGAVGSTVIVAVAAFIAILLLAIGELLISPISSYPGLVFGFSAPFCPILIMVFGVPAFFANMWFLRRAAPMNPDLAGFVAGACAGATGAWVYSWACVENGIPFIGIWYTLGILLSGVVGRYAGRSRLRW